MKPSFVPLILLELFLIRTPALDAQPQQPRSPANTASPNHRRQESPLADPPELQRLVKRSPNQSGEG
jgi:hypothetical protein